MEQIGDSEVENGLGVGVIAATGRIARHAEEVGDAQSVRAEEVALQREPVSVSTRKLDRGLYAPV